MPVPKRKTSKSRRDMRSSTKGLDFGSVGNCQTCQEAVAPHQVCQSCGYYKGVKVLRTKTDRMYERGQRRQQEEVQAKAEDAMSSQADNINEKKAE